MSEDQTQEIGTEQQTDSARPDELNMLKQRARMMGITFSNNIGLDALKEKIRIHQEGGNQNDEDKTDELGDGVNIVPPALQDPSQPTRKKPLNLRQQIIQDNMRLVRLRITCLDPKKKDLPGEVLTVANKYLGTVRKFIPFGEVTENGYYVPYCLYKMLKARKFLNIRTFRDRRNQNQIRVEQQWVPEFALEILPNATPAELQKLAAAQSAAGGLSD